MTEEEIIQNLKKCPSFNCCNQNLCVLDLDIELRTGRNQDKCRWMREPKKKKINGREFISGGRVMPDGILKFVPQCNFRWLNESSKKRWKQLKK